MKKSILKVMALGAVFVFGSATANAQGLLGKLKKAADKPQTEETAESSDPQEPVKALKWDKIPVYTAQVITLTDDHGQVLKNEDGSPLTRVILVDQFGNKRSAQAVEEQQNKIDKAITRILLKVGGGAALGAVAGLASGKGAGAAIGAAAGAAAGIGLSKDDIKVAKAQKKSLKEQRKLLEAYKKSFTAEGTPVDASADLTNVDGIDFTAGTSVSMSAESLKAELETADFNSSDDSAWNL